ncbi:unnamed protein product [Coregonus sp. 'balchen']|nr:unnamed protein product [Coregonus sp. 'balchen']
MELSLLRSARLGLEVLERASRRSTFYMSETEPMENERTHVCRYHSQSHQRPGTSLQTRKHARSSHEDFHIEVSPGTYKITAGTQDSQQQTRVVRINAGESMNLTFHL